MTNVLFRVKVEAGVAYEKKSLMFKTEGGLWKSKDAVPVMIQGSRENEPHLGAGSRKKRKI